MASRTTSASRGRAVDRSARLLKRWIDRLRLEDQPDLHPVARALGREILRLGPQLPDPEAAARLDTQLYEPATELVRRLGLEAALTILRDDLLARLAPVAIELGFGSEALASLAAHLGDACWRAYTTGLGSRLHQEEMEALRKELTMAKRIQERLLPRTVPQIEHFEIAGRVLPAREVGGDYWSCKWYPEDDIATFKLADVTGHGVAAALLVAAVKFISGGYYRGAKSAAQVMERTNHVLVKETPHEILVTMVYGWLYPTSRAVTLVNAGHSPLWHLRAGRVTSIEATGPALGLLETRYGERRIELVPGDLIFACSDGITQARGADSMGEARVRDVVLAHADRSAAEIRDSVLHAALDFYGSPVDDISLVVVRCVD